MANQDEKEQPNFVHHLRRNGYTTVGIGKLSHSVDGLIYGYQETFGCKRNAPQLIDLYSTPASETGWNAFLPMPMEKIVKV